MERRCDEVDADEDDEHDEADDRITTDDEVAECREINEALASRFMIIQMPVITEENLKKLISTNFSSLKDEYVSQFAELFTEIRKKCEGGEISSKALDLRGLLSAIHMMENGLRDPAAAV